MIFLIIIIFLLTLECCISGVKGVLIIEDDFLFFLDQNCITDWSNNLPVAVIHRLSACQYSLCIHIWFCIWHIRDCSSHLAPILVWVSCQNFFNTWREKISQIRNEIETDIEAVFLFTQGQFGLCVLSLPPSVCLSIFPCVDPERHILPSLKAIYFYIFRGSLNLKFNFKVKIYPILCLSPPNSHKRCKTPWLRSLLFWGLFDIDLQGKL